MVTSDGELLMNVGALATIAVMNPPNLAIVCVDNGHYGETGYQKSHTSLGTDLVMIATGSGIKLTQTIEQAADIAAGARLIREAKRNRLCLAARQADRAAARPARPGSGARTPALPGRPVGRVVPSEEIGPIPATSEIEKWRDVISRSGISLDRALRATVSQGNSGRPRVARTFPWLSQSPENRSIGKAPASKSMILQRFSHRRVSVSLAGAKRKSNALSEPFRV